MSDSLQSGSVSVEGHAAQLQEQFSSSILAVMLSPCQCRLCLVDGEALEPDSPHQVRTYKAGHCRVVNGLGRERSASGKSTQGQV